jgi:DNA-binding beta-propeller fold protein YncE
MLRLTSITLSKKKISVLQRAFVLGVLLSTIALQGVPRVSEANDDCPITEYSVPTPFSGPTDITTGPDGNLWFTESNAGKIGQITTSGMFTEFSLPAGNSPGEITLGPDGNLWFVTGEGVLSRRAILLPCSITPMTVECWQRSTEVSAKLLHHTDSYYSTEPALGGYFHIQFPDDWDNCDKNDFDWSELKNDPDRFQKIDYNSLKTRTKHSSSMRPRR